MPAGHAGALILSAHHANWEWLLPRCSTHSTSPDRRVQAHPSGSVDGGLRRLRERFGCTMVKAKELVPHLLAQRGQVRLLAMLADQSPAAASDQQTWLEFFGQPTPFFRGPGWIGAKIGYTVFFAAMHCERRALCRALYRAVRSGRGQSRTRS